MRRPSHNDSDGMEIRCVGGVLRFCSSLFFWWNEFEIGGSFVQFVRCFQVRVTIVYFRKRLLRKISLTSCTYDDVPLRHSHFSTPPNIHQKHKKRQQHLSVLEALYSQA